MHLVKNNQFEGIAVLGNQIARRVIGGDGKRQYLLLAAVIHPYVGGKGVDQPRIPLVQQINRRRNHHAGAIHPADRLNGDKRFPRARWEYNAPTSSSLVPCCQGCHLVIVWLSHLLHLEIERLPARDGITHLLLLQIRLERPIMIPLAAPPFLNQLEWRGRSLLYIHVPQDKGATLIVNRLAHGLYDSRVW